MEVEGAWWRSLVAKRSGDREATLHSRRVVLYVCALQQQPLYLLATVDVFWR